jgi:hypothetical protein
MQLVAADILAEARGLSYPFTAVGIILGALLWVFGWRWHRFWIVFITTVAAGVYGLSQQQSLGPRMLAAGLLLAVAAGLLALDLSRFVSFCTTGLACWLVVHAIVPTFQEPLISFLVGGIIGLLLYRWQWMFLSSAIGILLIAHCVLLSVEKASGLQFAAADWATKNAIGLNIGAIIVALLGLAVQGQLERFRAGKELRKKNRALAGLSEEERDHIKRMPRRKWFGLWPQQPHAHRGHRV